MVAPPLADQIRLSHILSDDLQPRINWAYDLEQDVDGLGAGYVTVGNGDPNGLITKPEGYLFLDLTTPAVWQNQNGGTVWTQLGAGGGGSGLPDPWTSNQTSGEVVATVDGTAKTALTIEAFAGQTAPLLLLKDENGNALVAASQQNPAFVVTGPPTLGPSDDILQLFDANQVNGFVVKASGQHDMYVDAALTGYAWKVFSDNNGRIGSPLTDLLFLDAFGRLELWTDSDIPCLLLHHVDNGTPGGPLIVGRNTADVDAFIVLASGAVEAAESVTVQAASGQSDPLLNLKDENGDSAFTAAGDGSGVVFAAVLGWAEAFVQTTTDVGGNDKTVTTVWQAVGDTGSVEATAALAIEDDGTAAACNFGVSRSGAGLTSLAQFEIGNDQVKVRVRAEGGQSDPLLQLQSSAGDDVARVLPSGAIGTLAGEPADGDINPGECFRYFDPTNGAARVCFKGKTLNGTVVESFGPMGP